MILKFGKKFRKGGKKLTVSWGTFFRVRKLFLKIGSAGYGGKMFLFLSYQPRVLQGVPLSWVGAPVFVKKSLGVSTKNFFLGGRFFYQQGGMRLEIVWLYIVTRKWGLLNERREPAWGIHGIFVFAQSVFFIISPCSHLPPRSDRGPPIINSILPTKLTFNEEKSNKAIF